MMMIKYQTAHCKQLHDIGIYWTTLN